MTFNVIVYLQIFLLLVWILALYLFKSRRTELIIATGSIVGTFILAEGLVYLVYPQIDESIKLYEPHNERGWSLKPRARAPVVVPGEVHHIVNINPQGYRDKNFRNIPDSVQKIAVIGDSFTSNIGVALDSVFTSIINSRLEGIRLLNFGVNGYGQVQQLLQLDEVIEHYTPSALIVVIYIRNDTTDNVDFDWLSFPRPYAELVNGVLHIKKGSVQPKKKSPSLLWQITHSSQVLSLISNQGGWLLAKLSEKKNNTDFSPSRITPPELYLCKKVLSDKIEQAFLVQEQLLLKIAAKAEQHSIPIVFTIAPTFVQVHQQHWKKLIEAYGLKESDYDIAAPNKRLVAFAKQHDLTMIDLLPGLLNEAQSGKQLYFPQEQHWNKIGNETVANLLLPHIKKINLSTRHK